MISSLGRLLLPAQSLIRSIATVQQPHQYTTVGGRLFSAIAPTSSAAPVVTKLPTSTESVELDKLYSKLEIELKGNDPAVLKSYSWFANTAAGHLGIDIGKSWALRRPHHNRFVLLKSVHIYKKHRVQYEIRTYYRFMHFHRLTESTANTFLEYIERNLPEGVAIKATRVEIQPLPEHLRVPPPQVE